MVESLVILDFLNEIENGYDRSYKFIYKLRVFIYVGRVFC